MPTIHKVKRTPGIAGQVQYDAVVEYEDEAPSTVSFVGSTYEGPVLMITGAVQTFVANPSRFGRFGEQWVRNFFEEA